MYWRFMVVVSLNTVFEGGGACLNGKVLTFQLNLYVQNKACKARWIRIHVL